MAFEKHKHVDIIYIYTYSYIGMYPWMFFHDILMLDAEKSPEISAGSAGSPVGSRAQAMPRKTAETPPSLEPMDEGPGAR